MAAMFPLNVVSGTICCLYKCFISKNHPNYCCKSCCCGNDTDYDSEPPTPSANPNTNASDPLIARSGISQKNIYNSSSHPPKILTLTTERSKIDNYAPPESDDMRLRVGSGRGYNNQFQFTPTHSASNTPPSQTKQVPTSEIGQEWFAEGLQRKQNDFSLIDPHIKCRSNAQNICLSIRRLRFIMIWYNEYMYRYEGDDRFDNDNDNASSHNRSHSRSGTGSATGSGNVFDSAILSKSKSIIEFICDGINYSFIELIDDFLHFKQYHFNYKFNPNILNNIYLQFKNTSIQCGMNDRNNANHMFTFCMAQSRNNRNRYECNDNKYNKMEVYGLQDNDIKNKQDTKLILMIYLDSIHCYIFHSYLLNEVQNDDDDDNKTNFPIQGMDEEEDDGFDVNHSKFITEIKDFEAEQDQDTESDDSENDYSEESKSNIPSQYEQDKVSFSFGSDLWEIDGTQYFYSVYNNLKDEMLHNESYRLGIHEWNDTYKQCVLYTKCAYYKSMKSQRDSKCREILRSATKIGDKPKLGKNCIEKGQYLTIDSLVALVLYSSYNNIRHHFKASFRANYQNERAFFIAKRHREWYNFSKILLSTIQAFGSIMDKTVYLYHSLTRNVFINQRNKKAMACLNFKFPISCTPIRSIAKDYSGNVDGGILMKLSMDNKKSNGLYGKKRRINGYMMDTSWLSEFPQEFEYLFYDLNVEMKVTKFYELNIHNDKTTITSSNIDGMDVIPINDDIFANMIQKFCNLFGVDTEIEYQYSRNKKFIDQNVSDLALLQILCRKMYINITNLNAAQIIFTPYMLEQFEIVSTGYNSQISWNNNMKQQFNQDLILFIDDLIFNKYLWMPLFPNVSIFIFDKIEGDTLEFMNKFLNQLQNNVINEGTIINEVQIKTINKIDIEKLVEMKYAQYFQQYGWSLFLPQLDDNDNNDNDNNDKTYTVAWRKIALGAKRQTAFTSMRVLNIDDSLNEELEDENGDDGN